ncbi:hypothetical protein K5549_011737 [Capra hircus]|nr:hypothetical protein K5549_011737 [Capra hircus]
MLLAALFTIAMTGKQPKCPSTEEGIKMQCIHTIEYYSAMEKNEIRPFAAAWVPLRIVILSESDSLVVCEVDPELKEKLRKFRFRKETDNAAIIMKVDKDRQMVVLEEEFQNISPEELKMELPERQPRFVVYSYKYVHADGRVSYPLCFIFSSPVASKPEHAMPSIAPHCPILCPLVPSQNMPLA